jgi:ABC-type sugar transport system substrate-binding protein
MSSNRSTKSTLRLLVMLAATMALAMFVVACGGDDKSSTSDSGGSNSSEPASTTDSGSGGGGAEGKKVALVACGDVNPWCKIYNKTIIDGLEAMGAEVQYLQDPFDPVLQVQNLNSAIAQKPDAILLVASDDNSIVPSLKKAEQQGVPVFNLNGRAADASIPMLESSILADQKKLGQFAAENIIEGLKAQGRESGNVMAITGTAATNTAKDRMEAWDAVFAENPQYKVVEVQDGNWDQVLTAKLAQQIFAKYQDKGGIAGAYGMADYQAAGIIQAAEQAGLKVGGKDGLIVTGSNCFKVGIDAIKAGKQYGTATQAPGPEGEFVVEVMKKWFEEGSVPETNLNEEFRITPDTVEEHAADCSKA